MIFKSEKHNPDLYNILLTLSRNIFFYSKIKLPDNFETRIYLMFMHFSIMMIIFKKKDKKFDQNIYDLLFHKIENNLRELGFGDVSVNKKMKEFNKILYDILLKIEVKDNNQKTFIINQKLVASYFKELSQVKSIEYFEFESYFSSFYHFCFELTLHNMVREAINFKK
jgi:cytochrome b pre-mRNA-processing protein 3